MQNLSFFLEPLESRQLLTAGTEDSLTQFTIDTLLCETIIVTAATLSFSNKFGFAVLQNFVWILLMTTPFATSVCIINSLVLLHNESSFSERVSTTFVTSSVTSIGLELLLPPP